MNEKEYLASRLDDQIEWYGSNSKSNQNRFNRLKFIEIGAAALIPFISGMGDKVPYFQWTLGVLGVLVAVSASITSLLKYQENWIRYRTTAEQLKHEKLIYLTNTKPYDTDDRFNLLVERVESLISKENSSWAIVKRRVEK